MTDNAVHFCPCPNCGAWVFAIWVKPPSVARRKFRKAMEGKDAR